MEICLLFSKHLRSVPPPPSFLCSCAPLSVLIPFWHLYLCLFGGRCHRVPFGCWLCLQPKTHSQRGFNNQKENCINVDFGVGCVKEEEEEEEQTPRTICDISIKLSRRRRLSLSRLASPLYRKRTHGTSQCKFRLGVDYFYHFEFKYAF